MLFGDVSDEAYARLVEKDYIQGCYVLVCTEGGARMAY
jgi:hypothetical protein